MAKPLVKSRTLATLAAVLVTYLLRAVASKLPAEVAQPLAEVLSDEVLGLLTAGATALITWFKRQDYAQVADLQARLDATTAELAKAQQPKKTVGDLLAIPAKRKPGTKVPQPGVTLLLMVLANALSGCGSTWPSACESDWGHVSCRCNRMVVATAARPDGAPAPAGRVTWVCDGKPLPLAVDVDDLPAAKP